jgi:tetratricopeptide (TPR) repeat protein
MRARILIVLLTLAGCLVGFGCAKPDEKIPITTSSEEAREYYLEGRTAFEQFQPEKARGLYMKALAVDPEFALAHLGMAQSSEDDAERRKWATAAAAKARATTRGERLLIRAYRAITRQDMKTAFLEVKELVSRYPREARAHLMLGDAYLAARNLGSAIKSYNTAVEIEPDLAAAHRNLGRAYLAFARHKEARLALTKHLELLPELPASHELLAVALMKGGAFAESTARYEEVQRLDPTNRTAWIGIGYNMLFAGDPDQAIAHFQNEYDNSSDIDTRLQAMEHIAAVHIDGGDTDKGIEQLQRAYSEAGEAPDGAYRLKRALGDLYLHDGRIDEAARELDQALADFARIGHRGPRAVVGRVYHLYDQARIAIARGRTEDGKSSALKFRRSIGNSRIPNGKDMWGELQTRLRLLEGDGEGARKQMDRVSETDPRLIYLAGQAQEAAGQQAQARMTYERVAEFNQPVFALCFVRTAAQERLAELAGS